MTTNDTAGRERRAAAQYDREEMALADALFVLGHTAQMIAPDVASDIIGYMRHKHDVILKREEWLCDPDAASAAAGSTRSWMDDDAETVTVSMFTARNAARTLRYFVASAKKTGKFDYGDEQTALAELDDAIAAESAEASGDTGGTE